MRELVLTPLFGRAFRRVIAKNLARMAEDLADPRLKNYRLSRQLGGLFACSVAYDCGIVFSKQKHPKTSEEPSLLVNIGTHEEVY